MTPADSSDLVGTWKFLSYVRSMPDTGEYVDIMGEHPNGYLIYTPGGRMMVIVVADEREPPKTDEDRIALHKFMVAYSGRYTVSGGQVTHHVDVSWNQSWTGTDLVRAFKIEDDKLVITTAPTKYGTDDVQQISTLTLQRADN
jgi:Lipocalin-like domain